MTEGERTLVNKLRERERQTIPKRDKELGILSGKVEQHSKS